MGENYETLLRKVERICREVHGNGALDRLRELADEIKAALLCREVHGNGALDRLRELADEIKAALPLPPAPADPAKN